MRDDLDTLTSLDRAESLYEGIMHKIDEAQRVLDDQRLAVNNDLEFSKRPFNLQIYDLVISAYIPRTSFYVAVEEHNILDFINQLHTYGKELKLDALLAPVPTTIETMTDFHRIHILRPEIFHGYFNRKSSDEEQGAQVIDSIFAPNPRGVATYELHLRDALISYNKEADRNSSALDNVKALLDMVLSSKSSSEFHRNLLALSLISSDDFSGNIEMVRTVSALVDEMHCKISANNPGKENLGDAMFTAFQEGTFDQLLNSFKEDLNQLQFKNTFLSFEDAKAGLENLQYYLQEVFKIPDTIFHVDIL